MADITPQDLLNAARARVNEEYILQDWNGRVRQRYLQEWHDGIHDIDLVTDGSAPVRCTDETIKDEGWKVTNLVQANADDIVRLTEESEDSVQCKPLDLTDDKEEKRAHVRAAIAKTWWMAGGGEFVKPELALDYAQTGVMLLACRFNDGSPYPEPWRIDPRYAYPSIVGNRLVDLMVVQTMHAREARALLGSAFDEGLDGVGYSSFLSKLKNRKDSEQVDVVDYYGPDALCTAVIARAGAKGVGAFFTQFETNPLFLIPGMKGRVPVAFRKRPGATLRGFVGQSIPKQIVANRIRTLQLDYADQAIYSPLFERGTDLEDQGWGPETVIHGRDADAMVQRVAPAGGNPLPDSLVAELEVAQRNEGAFPPSRQGDIPQAIASAAFVDATQGERSTLIRHINKRLSGVRQEWNEIGFAMVPRNVEAPLLVPVEGRSTYKPVDDIWRGGKPETQNEVTNSIASGVGKLNQMSILNQLKGNGIIPVEMVQEQIGEISDVRAAQELLDKEQVKLAFMQKLLTDPNSDVAFLAKLLKAMGTGKTVEDALTEVEDELARMAQQTQMQQQAAAGQPTPDQGLAPTGTEGAPANPQEQLSLVKGGVPGQAPELQGSGSFTPPPLPMTQIDIGRRT